MLIYFEVNQNILHLEISVNHADAVNIVDSSKNLEDDFRYGLLGQSLFFLDDFVNIRHQISVLHQLHHNIEVFFVVEQLQNMHNIWMVKHLQHCELIL